MNRIIKERPKNIVGIIPARMASSRFPGKPLAKICGIPMAGHVYLRSRLSRILNEVYLATCDKDIADYAGSIGCKAVMTSDTHKRASDRAAEALVKIERETGQRIDIAVMIQGDEPLLYPEMIDQAVSPMLMDRDIEVVNLMAAIRSKGEQDDPNTVKVTVDLNDYALYFSRENIPSGKKDGKKIKVTYKQVPVIPFRRDFLLKFNRLTPGKLEVIESVDMLRVLEHGNKIKMVLTKFNTHSVDTPQDLRKVERVMKKDKLFLRYRKQF